MFISRKLNEDLKFREVKPAIVNQQCLVYQFQCNLCDAGYVGYTRGHLHERVDGHKQKSSSICKHYLSEHNSVVPPFISEQFHVLTKGSNKFDCLIKEMLFIRKLKPSLNYPASRGFSLVFLSVVLPFFSRFWLLAFCFGCFCAEKKTSADSRLGFLLSMRIRYLQDLGGNHMTKPVVEPVLSTRASFLY